MSLLSRCDAMNGYFSVRNSATSDAARHGTATSGSPLSTVRMRLVANGVLVIAVFNPAPQYRKSGLPGKEVWLQ